MVISEFTDTILANAEYLKENMEVLEKDSLRPSSPKLKSLKNLWRFLILSQTEQVIVSEIYL